MMKKAYFYSLVILAGSHFILLVLCIGLFIWKSANQYNGWCNTTEIREYADQCTFSEYVEPQIFLSIITFVILCFPFTPVILCSALGVFVYYMMKSKEDLPAIEKQILRRTSQK
jgi:hypothetical protein